MAELDYAFLAEYAKVEPSGNLTAVGASYTHVAVSGFPAQHLVSVAGRVRIKLGETPSLRVRLQSPDESLTLEAGLQLAAGPDSRPYGPNLDTLGIQFAMTVALPLPVPGLYKVHVLLDDEEVRFLAFTASSPQGGGG